MRSERKWIGSRRVCAPKMGYQSQTFNSSISAFACISGGYLICCIVLLAEIIHRYNSEQGNDESDCDVWKNDEIENMCN